MAQLSQLLSRHLVGRTFGGVSLHVHSGSTSCLVIIAPLLNSVLVAARLRCSVRDCRELFGWPANADLIDSLAARAAGSVLPRVCHRPTREMRVLHHDVQVGASVDPSTYPLTGWLRYGAWQAWADALTTFRELQVLAAIVLARHFPTLSVARDFAVRRHRRRVVELWDGGIMVLCKVSRASQKWPFVHFLLWLNMDARL
eukprot:4224445-Amphidinium_carterae.3